MELSELTISGSGVTVGSVSQPILFDHANLQEKNPRKRMRKTLEKVDFGEIRKEHLDIKY